MRLNEYQVGAKETAVYPGEMKLAYPSLGLGGEGFEFIVKLLEGAEKDEIIKELGDILWYAATTASDADLTLFDCGCVERFDDLPGRPESKLMLPLCTSLGELLENSKKCYRDDDGKVTDERREKIRLAIGVLLNAMSEYAKRFDTTLTTVAEVNYKKLKSRQERGTLQGSGDNR